MDTMPDSLRKTITKLFVPDRQAFPTLLEAALPSKIAEAGLCRFSVPSLVRSTRNQCVRVREAAEYIGVSVAGLSR